MSEWTSTLFLHSSTARKHTYSETDELLSAYNRDLKLFLPWNFHFNNPQPRSTSIKFRNWCMAIFIENYLKLFLPWKLHRSDWSDHGPKPQVSALYFRYPRTHLQIWFRRLYLFLPFDWDNPKEIYRKNWSRHTDLLSFPREFPKSDGQTLIYNMTCFSVQPHYTSRLQVSFRHIQATLIIMYIYSTRLSNESACFIHIHQQKGL